MRCPGPRQAELEAELAQELWSFDIDPEEGRLSDDSYRLATAALASRRGEMLSRRGKRSTAYAQYQHSTLTHYLHQVPFIQLLLIIPVSNPSIAGGIS
jgi:hypothetical protein